MWKSTPHATIELAPIRQSKCGCNDDLEPDMPNVQHVKRMCSVWNLLCLLYWNLNFYQMKAVSPIREDGTGSDEEDNIGEEATLQPVGSTMVSPFCHTEDPEVNMHGTLFYQTTVVSPNHKDPLGSEEANNIAEEATLPCVGSQIGQKVSS